MSRLITVKYCKCHKYAYAKHETNIVHHGRLTLHGTRTITNHDHTANNGSSLYALNLISNLCKITPWATRLKLQLKKLTGGQAERISAYKKTPAVSPAAANKSETIEKSTLSHNLMFVIRSVTSLVIDMNECAFHIR